MNLSWKLIPIAVVAALGFLALVPGGGARPQVVSATDCTGDDVGQLDIRVTTNGVSEVSVEGFRVVISPDPSDHENTMTVVDDGANDDVDGNLGRLGVTDACQTDHADFGAGGYTVTLSAVADSDADNCAIEDDVAADVDLTGPAGVIAVVVFEVNCNTTPTATATVTGTPATATPTVTGTVTGDTVTISAVPGNPVCGSPSFIFATVRNAAGVPLANQTVTFAAAGGIGSFNPVSVQTVADGVASTTYSPPATGAETIAITASANGKSASTSVTTSCSAPAPTNTPQPPAPSSPIRPPSTGDAGLMGNHGGAVYAGFALMLVLAFVGAVAMARQRS